MTIIKRSCCTSTAPLADSWARFIRGAGVWAKRPVEQAIKAQATIILGVFMVVTGMQRR
jgi:hypothetical protein